MEEKTRAIYLADLDYFQSQLEESSQSTLYLPVAAIYARLEKYEEALSVSTRGLEINPGHTQIQVLLAESMIHVGRKDEAREILYDILMADEDNYKALKLLGQIFRSDGDKESAVKFMRAAYLKSPEDDELIIALEEMGESVARPAQGQAENAVESESFEDEEENDYNFNVDANISNAEIAISDVLRDISGQKPTVVATESVAAAESLIPANYPENVSILGQELSDDEILKALISEQLPDAGKETADDNAFQAGQAPSQVDLADMLSALPQDTDTLLPASEPDGSEVFPPPAPEPQVFIQEPPAFLADGVQNDIETVMLESLSDLETVLGAPAPRNTGNMEYSVEMPEDNDTQLPEELVSVLQGVAPQQNDVSVMGEVVELSNADTFFNLIDDDEVLEPFIPSDFARDVFREAGLDAANINDEPITPESVRQEKESENK